jgi:hypothetical protein
MKKVIITVAMIIVLLPSTFAQFMQGSLIGWPNTVSQSTVKSTAYKIVSDATYYYALTGDQGIWRIPKANIATGTWTSYNSGLPAAGLINGFPYYAIGDIEISGGYLWVSCSASGNNTQKIYRALLTSSSFTNITPSTALLANVNYIFKAVGSYMYMLNSYTNTLIDIRYTPNGTIAWSTLTINPGGVTPDFVYSFNAVTLPGRYDLNICSSNGLFVKGLSSTGAPTGGQGQSTSLAQCTAIDFLYNSSGVFTWAYLIQRVPTTPGHTSPLNILRIPSGSGTAQSVTMPTPSALGGTITSLAAWSGNPHFGVQSGSSALSAVLYRGDVNATNYVVSNFCGGAGGGGVSNTTGTTCMYGDGTTRLLAGEAANGVWFTTNLACKNSGTTGVDEVAEESLTVYPVPARDELTINYSTVDGTQPEIALYDLQGRLVNAPINYIGKGEAKMNVSSLDRGMYLLSYNNGTKITKRIVVE